MEDGVRITEEVEKFLRAARAKEFGTCEAMLTATPSLVDECDAGGYSALHFAAFNGDCQMIGLLRRCGANFNIENYDNNAPLVMAVKGRQLGAIRALIEGGADPNHLSPTGAAPIHHAASMGYMDCFRTLAECGSRVAFEPSEAGSVLHWACHSGQVDVVGEVLYKYNIAVDVQDVHGGTPLLTALFMKKTELVEFLLEHGADPCVTIPADGSTALLIAVEHANSECVRLLCGFGADPRKKNIEGISPMDYCAKVKKDVLLKELKKPQLPAAEREDAAAKLKEKGNKVFAQGENVKAAKIYSLAIRYDRSNHVYYSNRAACYFNQRHYSGAFWDACRCIHLSPQWPKGYLRKAATELAMKRYDDASATADQGLKIDPSNKDLSNIKEECFKQLKK